MCEAGSPNVWGAEAKAGPVSATPASGSGRPGRRCLGEGCGPGHPPGPRGRARLHPLGPFLCPRRRGLSSSTGACPWAAGPGCHRRPSLAATLSGVRLAAGIAPSGLACDSEPRRRPLGRAGRRGSGRTRTHPLPPLAGRLRWSGEGPASRKARRRKVGGPGSGAGLPGLWCRWRGDRSEPPSRRLTVAGRCGASGPEPSVPLRASDAPGSCRYYTFTCSGSEPRADRRAGPPAPGTAGPRVPHHVPRHSDEVPGEHDSPGPGLSGDGAGVPTAAKPTQRPPGNPGPAQPEPPSRLPGAASPTRRPSGQRLAPPGRVGCGVPRALLRLQPHLPGWGSGDFLGRSRRLDSIHERGCSFGGSDSHLTPYCNFPINCDLNKLKWLTRLSSR